MAESPSTTWPRKVSLTFRKESIIEWKLEYVALLRKMKVIIVAAYVRDRDYRYVESSIIIIAPAASARAFE